MSRFSAETEIPPNRRSRSITIRLYIGTNLSLLKASLLKNNAKSGKTLMKNIAYSENFAYSQFKNRKLFWTKLLLKIVLCKIVAIQKQLIYSSNSVSKNITNCIKPKNKK